MANQTRQILIESILGGQSVYENFSGPDEFKSSTGIDPDQSVGAGPSGYIIPSFVSSVSSFAERPMWMVTEPKIGSNLFVYDVDGSVYTATESTITGLTDLNDGGTAAGNGMAYYDNYIYAARATTVARYGPLNGTPAWTDDYWVATLSKTALVNTTYPVVKSGNIRQPNHVMLRHSNGKLYFADVVGNQGVIHCISTTKTTVEGDTDNGSTYIAVDFPYGMWPTALASYGDRIAVALYEGVASPTTRGGRAKVAFWDPTNTNTYDLIFSEEFPDTIITALVNTNGVLYAFSGDLNGNDDEGVRVSRFAGGYTFEQIAAIDYAELPIPGGVDTDLNKVVFGSTAGGQSNGAVYAIGSRVSPVSNSLFTIYGGMRQVMALKYAFTSDFSDKRLAIAAPHPTASTSVLWIPATSTGAGGEVTVADFVGPTYRIGRSFKVTKIVLNLTSALTQTSTQTIRVSTQSFSNDITYSTYGTKTHIVMRPSSCTGDSDFNLTLEFGGILGTEETIVGVKLPILIEYELLPDDE